MPDLAPWPAIRYGPEAGDPGDLLAPPYDVIGPGKARELRESGPFNAVRLVLPEGDAPGRYELAARRLRDWLEDGILVRDDRPFLYVYGHTFEHRGATATRHGVFGALRLSPFHEGEILPHEETHRGPREDRLALMRACRAQLSPVFLLATDPSGRLPSLLGRAARGTPVLEAGTRDGLQHRLWRVPEGPLADDLRAALARGPLLVADGHHRYETALEMARGKPEEHTARRTLACVVGRRDPGLICLPTHRALRRPPPGPDEGDGEGSGHALWEALLGETFGVEPLGGSDPEAAARAAAGAGAVAVVPGGGAPAFLLRPAAGGVREPGDPAPAPIVFDRRILRRTYHLDPDTAVERGLLSYHRDAAEAAVAAGEGGAAFLLPPPDVDAVWERARQGERMPPKSTYFWPKLPSGLVFRLLDQDE